MSGCWHIKHRMAEDEAKDFFRALSDEDPGSAEYPIN